MSTPNSQLPIPKSRLLFLAAVVCAGGATLSTLQTPVSKNVEPAYRSNNVGVALLEQFDYDAAARSFREALELHPELAIARLNLAIALFYGGHATDAASEARTAAARLSDVPNAHYIVGLIARGEDNADAATTAFERVLKIDPADAGAQVNLGQLALQQRQYDRALTLFRGALAAEPFNVTAAYSIALALTRSGRAEEGRKAMQAFEALRDSAYGVTYAQTYLAQGKYAEAIASTGAEAELVDPAMPKVTFSDATGTSLPSQPAAAGERRGGVTLVDADGDGDLDLFEIGGARQRFLRNQKGIFADETERVGLVASSGGVGLGAIAGDYDNDNRPDLFLLRAGGHRLLRQKTDGSFEDVSARAGLPQAVPEATAAVFADVDHDGDLDILITGSPTQLLRNNGNGTFADIAVQAGVSEPVRAVGIAATDYDNRRDIDFLIAAARGPILYRNMRDGSFRNAARETGLPADGNYSALGAGDINKDGFTDFFLAKSDESGVLALSDGQTHFRLSQAPEGSRGAVAAQFVDYDNDGLLDLLTLSETGSRLFRNLSAGKWSDVSDASRLSTLASGKSMPSGARLEALALGDIDSDGDSDAVVRLTNGELRIWKNDGGNRNTSLRVRLAARVSNRSGVGTKVDMRAGSLRQQFETSSSTPAVAPAEIVFGLGSRSAADVVRVLWPSGILQAETKLAGEGTAAPLSRSHTITVAELDRKPSSCPYLFTWNGRQFEFVTDFMGGGEVGAWLAPGVWNHPDADEYVRLAPRQLQPRGGYYELRVTNELEEALFVDRMQLVAVDHPDGVEVFSNEGLRSPPHPPFALTTTRNARPPVKAVDEHGHDVLPLIASLDRRYPDDFGLLSIRGYAEPHLLTLDLGRSAPDASALLMTGWTDYAFSNDNVSASQRGETMRPPSVEVRDASGKWKTVIPEMGFPVGRPQTVPVNLKGKWLSRSREVRIATNMRIYWDEVLVDTSGGGFATRTTRLDPVSANLRWRGFSAETTPDGREPFGYDYSRVSGISPWKSLVGRYTREGDVRPLLREVDDMFVISRPGDELALAFDARALPALQSGWARTFFVYAHGYSKEMNPRSAGPEHVGPLPFLRMTGYPYESGEHYPRTKKHLEYLERYNTRIVGRSVPSIDARLR